MNIYFDHQTFTDQTHGGVSRYFSELIAGIDELPEHKALLGLWRSNNEYLRNHRPGVKPFFPNRYVPKKINILRWFNKRTSTKEAARLNFDVYHPTGYTPSLLENIGKRPLVVTFYDMIHEKIGQGNELAKDYTMPGYKREMAQRADKILAISENTKTDLIEILDVPSDKIEVIHLASSMPVIKPDSLPHYSPQKPYLLYVGTRRHYKNFDTFLLAAAPLLAQYGVDIVCAGGGVFSRAEQDVIRQAGVEKAVYQVSSSDARLMQLYNRAIAFVFPTKYEGFGIPILEAFSCGCPCLLSNTSSLPEVGSDAALYFDPSSVGSMQATIQMLLDNSGLRGPMIQRGFERLRRFSWQNTVQKTVAVYETLA